MKIVLDGSSLSLADVARLARDPRVRVEVTEEAMARIRASRELIEGIAQRYR